MAKCLKGEGNLIYQNRNEGGLAAVVALRLRRKGRHTYIYMNVFRFVRALAPHTVVALLKERVSE